MGQVADLKGTGAKDGSFSKIRYVVGSLQTRARSCGLSSTLQATTSASLERSADHLSDSFRTAAIAAPTSPLAYARALNDWRMSSSTTQDEHAPSVTGSQLVALRAELQPKKRGRD